MRLNYGLAFVIVLLILNPMFTLAQEDVVIFAVAWSPDGQYIAVGGEIRSSDRSQARPPVLQIVDAQTMTIIHDLSEDVPVGINLCCVES